MTQTAQNTTSPSLFLSGLTIVLRGSFNPTIFHPAWFVHEGLIRKDEGESANTEIVHQQISVLTMKWFRLQVETNRFMASSTQEHKFDALRDLVTGTFRLLHHTPVTALGINLESHYQMHSKEVWNAFGDRLAPKGSWGFVSNPGLLTLVMNTQRPDGLKGYINIRVEPSKNIEPGIFIEVNDHIQLEKEEKSVQNADLMLTSLEQCWKDSLKRSEQITRSIMEIK